MGITGKYKNEGLFLTGGIYDVLGAEGSSGDNTEVIMFAAQTGFQYEGDEMDFVIAGGIQLFNDSAYEAVNNFLNGARHGGPLNREANFTIGDVYAKLNKNFENFKLQLHSHIANNFGADNKGGSQLGQANVKPENENLAWLVGVKGKWGPGNTRN